VEWPRTFNPGVVVVNGTFHMLYRGSTQSNFSEIGAATSTDGLHWTQYAGNPVISRSLPNETQGTEDPRLYYQNGTYYAFFTGYNGSTVDINEAVSTDAIHIYGYTPHTVFMNTILFYENHWWLYYGAGDTVSALATAPLRHRPA
jgi:predicted GH43/DUF377 family glycosyl hydrolase